MSSRPGAVLHLGEEVARAARRPRSLRTLLLDLDGTLAPLVPRPEQARVPRPALEALEALARGGWTVAVVSGRPASAARRMIPLESVRIFGSHGLEGSWSGRARPVVAPSIRRRLRSLLVRGRGATRGIPGSMVEPKPAGVGFHDRRVLPGLRPEWRRRVREILSGSDLEGLVILEGHRVVEVRPKGCSKGSVVNSYPPARRRAKMDASFLAMGDDTTDEDMFRAIRGKGLGVLVGPPRAFTDAARRLASPLQVTRFLSFLADRIA